MAHHKINANNCSNIQTNSLVNNIAVKNSLAFSMIPTPTSYHYSHPMVKNMHFHYLEYLRS